MRFTRLHALPATLALVTLLPACRDDSVADPTGETADARTPDAFVGDAHQDTWDAVVDAARPDTAALPDASTDAAPATPDVAPPPSATLGAGRFRLEVRAAPFGLTLTRDGAPIAQVRRIDAAFAETREEAFDRSKYYDPAKPATYRVTWETLSPVGEPGADGVPTRLAVGDWQAAFTLGTDAEGRFTAEVVPDDPDRLVQLRLVLDAPEGEAYYGLGELFDTPEHRGKHRPMQIGPDIHSEGFYSEYHVAVPLLIGTGGWGLFVEDRHPADFDVAASDPEHIQVVFETKRLKFHLFGADTPTNVLPHYVALTGQPARPAEFAFGGWIWRNENRDQQQVYDDLRALRENDLPMSGMWLDRPWATGINTFVMDPAKFPDPEGLVAAVHAAGLRFAVWASPYLAPDTGELWQTASDNGWFVRTPPGWPKSFDADFVDLTNPDAAMYFKGIIQRITDLGAQGFKLDFGEDVQVGSGPVALPFDFHNGETERTMHHGIAPYYHRPFAELTGGDAQGFILSRAGTYGDQTLTTTIWPGDLCNGFEKYQENRHVGGLPAAIAGGLSLSTSGYPWFASDTGGYRHGRAPKEVFLRWVAYSALGTVMQTGGSEQHNPWDFEEHETGRDAEPVSQFDTETLSIYRDFARLFIRLHAYRHPFNEDAHETGRPVTRPLGFAHPELGVHPATQYLLGDALLVTPVIDETGMVEVVFPAGRFYDWFTGELVEGPTTMQREIPFDRIALYARAGAIVPLLRDTVDTLAPATDPDVDSYANDPGVLTVRLYPGEGRRTFETLGGTRITVEDDTVTLTGDHFTGYVFELHGRGGEPVRLERGPGAQSFELPPAP